MKVTMALALLACPLWGQTTSSVVDTNLAGVANLPAQKIQPNDLIAVSVYDEPALTRTVRVGEDGAIRLPMLQAPVAAGGLMPADLETAIGNALRDGEILVNPIVAVTILEYSSSRMISVVGAVRKPLTFTIVGTVRLLDALARAEGLSNDAGPELLVTRAGADFSQRIVLKDLIDGSNPQLNIVLEGGEDIRVPEARKIYVLGNVKKPGAFPVRDGSENTVLKLLAMVEGVTSYSAKEAYIYRAGGDGQPRQEIRLELKKILARKAPDVSLSADDILYVPDATGLRMGLTVLEKTAMYGGGAAAAVIYAGAR